MTGYTFVQNDAGPPKGWNAACNVFSGSAEPVDVVLVWDFSMFVTNYAADSGVIG